MFRQVQRCMMKLFFLRFACLGMEDMRQIESCNRNSGNFTKFTLASTVITVEI